ncbi:WSC-domain-containing protein [Cristinia sonorae]|uniref:WSC-domain-containing protein n=1 Tax=Cristinia sonorae TaxID=1940300 RepID=A0A8K0UG14_9AGAR|nr:WSC-domain-containing protein [Cristinia sonorae]
MLFLAGLLGALAAAPSAHAVHVIFGGIKPVVTTRLDPIVNPGQLSSHLHTVAGGNGFKNTYSYDALTSESTCSTVVLQEDKSNYWTPSVYHQDPKNGSFTLMPASFNVYYLIRGEDTGDKIVPPPKGLVMLAGNPNRRTYNANNKEDQAVSFVCLDYSGAHNGDPEWAERPDFFKHNCPNGMRAQVFFPQCWDGKNLDSPDHKSHMAYPIQNYNGGKCPSTHPVHIISIFYEMFVSVDQFEYHGPGTWTLSNGDTTGLGFHGDFAMGWTDISLLDALINDCPNAAGNVADCPAMAKRMNPDAASACRFKGAVVDEPIGDKFPLAQLPGCNPLWTGTGAKPTCTGAIPTPALVDTQVPLLAGWSKIGCIAEGKNGRALTGAQLVDAQGMTINKCASFCASKGFPYAGVEWSQECYCGNALSNGATQNTVAADQCSNVCPGNQYDTCGGPQRLTLIHNPNPGQTPPQAPSSSVPPKPSTSSVPPKPSSSAPASPSAPAPQPTSSVPPKPSTSSVPPKPSTSSVPPKPSSSSIPPKPSSSSVPPRPSPSSSSPPAHTLIPTPSPSASSTPVATSSAAPLPSPTAPVVNGWIADGCLKDDSSRVLTGLSTASNTMTVGLCQSLCDAKGFQYSGLEYGSECYCGNFLSGGRKDAAAGACDMKCVDGQLCGGNWALNLFRKPNAPATPVVSPTTPSGWTAGECAQDGGHRALTGYSFTSDSLTVATCISTCDKKGFSIAGVEWGRECYCGNSFVNGLGQAIDAAKCNMRTTSGDPAGGSMALSIFRKTGSNTKRAPKAKHFGRNAHAHQI